VPTFKTSLVVEGRGAHVVVPAPVIDALGGGGRIPVQARFDAVEYQGSVVSMGGKMVIGVPKAIREQMGKGNGDAVEVVLDRDVAERTVDVPDDLAKALKAAGVTKQWDALAYTYRKEHVRSITEAKKPETRTSRIQKAVDALKG
jgi:bifunctional DNA-binding transcriptional regulator/antitoxin component of YhaV-PrlF toxin-antitoxin module